MPEGVLQTTSHRIGPNAAFGLQNLEDDPTACKDQQVSLSQSTQTLESLYSTAHALLVINNLMRPPGLIRYVDYELLWNTIRGIWNKLILDSTPIEVGLNRSRPTSTNTTSLPSVSPFEFETVVSVSVKDEIMKLSCQCLLNLYRICPDEPSILFELLPVLSRRSSSDYSFLVDFCRTEFPRKFSPSSIKKCLLYFFGKIFPGDGSNHSSEDKKQDQGSAHGSSERKKLELETKIKGLQVRILRIEC